MGEEKKKGEQKNEGVGGLVVRVGFRICNDNVCPTINTVPKAHQWQTVEGQDACGDCIIMVHSCQEEEGLNKHGGGHWAWGAFCHKAGKMHHSKPKR